MANWRRFEDVVDQPGPFIWRATRSHVQPELRLIRRGKLRLVPLTELEKRLV